MAATSRDRRSGGRLDPVARIDRLGAPPDGARRAAELMQKRLDEIVEAFIARLAANPELEAWVDAELFPRDNSAADIGRELRALADGVLPRSCPDEVAASAALAVAGGFPLSAALQCYRTGHQVQWDAWVDAVGSLEASPEAEKALLDWGSRFMFEYADRCSWWIERAYLRAREAQRERLNRERLEAVRSVLAGVPSAEVAIDYDVNALHTALLVDGPEAEAVFDSIRSAFDASVFNVEAEPGRWWGWVPTAARDQTESLGRMSLPGRTLLAVGGPHAGVTGFRSAHREAELAMNIAHRRPDAPALFARRPLVALALADEPVAAALIERELGELAGDSETAAKLRETLDAYFACGQNAASTAAVLGVHERTVANRVRTIEQRLGIRLVARLSEISVALDLYRFLHADA